ncbi:MAG: class I SAM-dependent methyltransferase [Muribaculaceae bacterium]|nr:class I SAM-dependent methyltransferase [Muribaculaceae bacterium]
MQLQKEFFDWVREHAADDPSRLRLAMAGKKGNIDYAAAITQIECRRKFSAKLRDTLASFPDFYFPSVLAGEQSTSDLLAEYHASFVPEALPAVDFTAGLGIDVFHIASRASSVTAIELDASRAEAVVFNAAGLNVDNVEVVTGNCKDYIADCVAKGKKFEVGFIDPARRASDGSRVFALADCEPDVVTMLPDLRRICRLLIIKASPMLDISHTLEALGQGVIAAIAVGTPTECKELLLVMDFEASDNNKTLVEAVTLRPQGSETFAYTLEEERELPMPGASGDLKAGDFLYEPSPSLMKSGAFKVLAKRYALSVIHPNTRLFYSANKVDEFPGDVYCVERIFPYASKIIKRFRREYPRVNVTTRNFGMTGDALRAKLGVSDGGDLRLFAFTDSHGERLMALCSKAKK